MEIKWSESRNAENTKVVRANIGLHFVIFSYNAEVLTVGADRSCLPTEAELTQMIAEAPAAIDALMATAKPVSRPKMSAYRNDYRYDAKTGYRGGSLAAEMSLEDSAY
jgi:hypothetical protein